MTSLVPSDTDVHDLVRHVLNHLEGLGYAAGTLANYRSVYEAFLRFAEQEAKTESLSTALVQRFLELHEIPADWTATELTFHQRHVRTVRRVLTEYALHGCFQRRSRIVSETKLAPALQRLLCGYEEFHVKHVQSSSETLRARKRQITHYRMDADHASCGGQDGQPGRGCWSLPTPSSRANPCLSDR